MRLGCETKGGMVFYTSEIYYAASNHTSCKQHLPQNTKLVSNFDLAWTVLPLWQ